MKKVLFDIMHPAHVNFFVNLVKKLESNNIDVDIITLDRGPVVKMVKKEYPEIASKVVGKYSPSLFGVFLKTGFIRAWQILGQIFGKKYDAFVGVAAFQLGFVGKFSKTKSIIIYDDPEHKVCFNLSKWIANKFYLPRFCNVSANNIYLFNSLKEWAYLSPKYFKPNSVVLEKYHLKPMEYIFIREVDNKSLNYRNHEMSIIEGLHEGGTLPVKVVLSLENKSRKNIYKGWIILEEPVEDIHSLMYFSKAVISNGDSMAREGAMLGVDSIYCGERDMRANKELIDRGLLKQITNINQLKNVLSEKFRNDSNQKNTKQEEVRNRLLNEWDDVNEILFEEIVR